MQIEKPSSGLMFFTEGEREANPPVAHGRMMQYETRIWRLDEPNRSAGEPFKGGEGDHRR